MPRHPRSLRLLALLGLIAAAPALAAPFALDAERSLFYGVLAPSGVLGSAAGTHVVESDDFDTRLCLEPGEPLSLRGRFVVGLTDIQLDTERALDAEGLEAPPGGFVAGLIEREMKGPRALDVERYPTIAFTIEDVREGLDGTPLFVGPLTLHGTTREVEIPVEITRADDGALSYDGRFTIDQSEFGVEPLSIPGVLSVDEELALRVRIVGAVGGGAC